MGKKLLHGNRDEKVEAAINIVKWAAVCGFTLSTVSYYLKPFLHADFNDEVAAAVGVILGVLGGLKFSA
ncbi:MAG TPA: hypothetical protein VEK73_13915 [Xanthobacteraceae bacterium]|nr:hypothetical protein [Xanthobacteraceae bacterium]